jgi:large subunit ribosomal protein L9
MEVILRDNIENLGRRGEVVKVADGYARNYLLPRKLALPATPANMKVVERQRRIAEAHEASERADAESIAVRLTQAECIIARRVGEHDTLYGSVTAADIAECLAGKGFVVDKRRIQVEEPLKQLGEFTVPIKLHRDVVAQLRVRVTPPEEQTTGGAAAAAAGCGPAGPSWPDSMPGGRATREGPVLWHRGAVSVILPQERAGRL